MFKDLVHGKVIFDNSVIDDQVIIKNDGYPTYHFANVIDDYLMGITHVIRGEEWLPSTPKHLILYDMFGWQQPEFAHLPLLLNSKGQKLSKRFGDVSVQSYMDKGYLNEALMNSIALLGWNPPQPDESNDANSFNHEVLSLQDMVQDFNLEKVSKSGAKFDIDKLSFFNSMHIRLRYAHTSDEELNTALTKWRSMLE